MYVANNRLRIISTDGTKQIGPTRTINGVSYDSWAQSVADDATVDVCYAKAGKIQVWVNGQNTYLEAVFNSAGTPTLVTGMYSADVDTADTDTKLCIYAADGWLVIKNRLGSSKTIRYEVVYQTP